MKALDCIALILIIVGGLNWGLVGIFEFNLVETVCDAIVGEPEVAYAQDVAGDEAAAEEAEAAAEEPAAEEPAAEEPAAEEAAAEEAEVAAEKPAEEVAAEAEAAAEEEADAMTWLERLIYILVGVSAVWALVRLPVLACPARKS